MYGTRSNQALAVREASPATMLAFPSQANAVAECIIAHLVQRDVLRLESPAASHIRAIFTAPPDSLRVGRIARRMYKSRRTIGRHFRAAGLPSPIDWVALARALYAHRAIVRGAPLRLAASAGGYPEQFTMSNAIYRITGLRPSRLHDVSWEALVDVWIARQRERGTLTRPSTPARAGCALCGMVAAS